VLSKGKIVADIRKDKTSIEELEQIQISGKKAEIPGN